MSKKVAFIVGGLVICIIGLSIYLIGLFSPQFRQKLPLNQFVPLSNKPSPTLMPSPTIAVQAYHYSGQVTGWDGYQNFLTLKLDKTNRELKYQIPAAVGITYHLNKPGKPLLEFTVAAVSKDEWYTIFCIGNRVEITFDPKVSPITKIHNLDDRPCMKKP
jgi:hypothetical protein